MSKATAFATAPISFFANKFCRACPTPVNYYIRKAGYEQYKSRDFLSTNKDIYQKIYAY